MTPEGQALLTSGRAVKVAALRRRLDGLPPAERARLEDALTALELMGGATRPRTVTLDPWRSCRFGPDDADRPGAVRRRGQRRARRGLALAAPRHAEGRRGPVPPRLGRRGRDSVPRRWSTAGRSPSRRFATSEYDNLHLAWVGVQVAPGAPPPGHGTEVLEALVEETARSGRTSIGIDGWDARGHPRASRAAARARAEEPRDPAAPAAGRPGLGEIERLHARRGRCFGVRGRAPRRAARPTTSWTPWR